MALSSLVEAASRGFVERGRSIVSTHVVDLPIGAADAPARGSATHLEVIVVKGPFGQEVLVQPRHGDECLVGELYAQIPGAFGAPGAHDASSGPGLSWTSPHPGLEEYLRTHEFGASALPGGQRGGTHDIDLAWSIQFHALAADQTLVVCQIDGSQDGVVNHALVAVDRLASVTSQTRAAGPEQGLHPLRYGHIVGRVLSGDLDDAPPPSPAPPSTTPPAPTPPPPAPPAPTATDASAPPPPDPATSTPPATDTPSATAPIPAPSPSNIDERAAVIEALERYEGKRVTVGPITDQKKLANVLAAVARGVDPETICGFVDTGVRANGKSGVVFTPSSMHFSGLGDRRHYGYDEIESFTLESSAVVLTGIDGSRTKLTTSGQTLAVAEAVVAATGLLV